MKYLLSTLIVLLYLVGVSAQDKPKDVVDKLLDNACTIRAGRSQGSGVIIKRGDINFVWTAAHVVEDMRKAKEVIDPKTGGKKFIVTFFTVVLLFFASLIVFINILFKVSIKSIPYISRIIEYVACVSFGGPKKGLALGSIK